MGREIKFRAFVNNEMHDVISIDFVEQTVTLSDGDIYKISEIELLQYTGLKDKNGKKIYEGDILDVCNGSINGIKWKDKPYAVKYIANSGFNTPRFCWTKDGENYMDSTHWCIIIGNIFENPELLEKK